MSSQYITGLFGKLPAHGDFIHRNLPADFINHWDEWLQRYIATSQELLGESWLNIYLTSPIWRFTFTPGVVDGRAWAGIMMPSVDRVGRYFPFSILTQLPENLNPLEFITLYSGWFDETEELCFQALEGELQADDMMDQILNIDYNNNSAYQRTGPTTESPAILVDMDVEQPTASVYPYILDSLLSKSFSSYSTWSTQGSELVTPCFFTVQGLPSPGGVTAMMDGQWSQHNWPQTYSLNTKK